MRRGRPTVASQPHATKPSPSPIRGPASDPWAALDSKSPPGTVDELSSRFPSLDQFSLLHDGGKFDFAANSPPKPAPARDLNQRVAEKLADDAFAIPVKQAPTVNVQPTAVSKAQTIISNNPELQAPSTVVYEPIPTRIINSAYVSQGTMTSPNPTPPPVGQSIKYAPSPVQRFPPSNHSRSSSVPRTEDNTPNRSPWLRPQQVFEQQPNLASRHNSVNLQPGHARNISSSRPSLEGGRPSQDAMDPIARARSSNSRPRPSSTYLESNMDFLREKEASGRPSMSEKRNSSYTKDPVTGDFSSEEDTNISSNVSYLRSMEDTESSKKDRRRSSTSNNTKSKRASLPSMSLSGTKNLLAGKFGDAFKRFEHNAPQSPRTPSPHDLDRRDLTPIAGSEATDGRSDDGRGEDMDNLPPEQRRELERRRLSMEEKRVANAAAEYRQRLAERGPNPPPRSIGGVSRATSIQNKVKSLLDESNQSPKKTAEGYGRFTTDPAPTQASVFRSQMPSSTPPNNPPPNNMIYGGNVQPSATVPLRKPITSPNIGVVHSRTVPIQSHHPQLQQDDPNYPKPRSQQLPLVSPPSSNFNNPNNPVMSNSKTGGPRPSAPPKPMHLNSVSTGPQGQSQSSNAGRVVARPDMSLQEKEDYMKDFSKRFPSLHGIELVEREIDSSAAGGGRGREI